MNLPSKILAIDTATKSIYLALLIDGQTVDSITQEGESNHSVTIMPLIDQLLTKYQLQLNQIEGILVGIGPGSYTGVRIGVSIAKMIAYLNSVKLYSFSSLALLASCSEEINILSAIDARRGNAFLSTYQQNNEILTVVHQDQLTNTDAFIANLNEIHDYVTEGMPKIEKLINSHLIYQVDDVHALVPNYLQITEAERNKAL